MAIPSKIDITSKPENTLFCFHFEGFDLKCFLKGFHALEITSYLNN